MYELIEWYKIWYIILIWSYMHICGHMLIIKLNEPELESEEDYICRKLCMYVYIGETYIREYHPNVNGLIY